MRRREVFLFGTGIALSLVLLAVSAYRLRYPVAESLPILAAAQAFIAGVALLTGCRWSLLFLFSFLGRRQHWRPERGALREWPLVSVFVPAFNEGRTIEAALDSLLELDYPRYEVLVVNDGSADDTLERARRYEGSHGGCTVRVIDKPNGGKWSAHNTAFRCSHGELILCIDADSRLDPGSLKRLVARMDDPRIAGVAGQMRVRNRVNVITRLQGLEYLIANGAVRMGQGYCGAVLIVPGPIGLFRRTSMEEVFRAYAREEDDPGAGRISGPFQGDTFAEDFDLSLAILCLGGRIVYETDAISHTTAPSHHFALLNQRYRWVRGSLQVLRKFAGRAWQDHRILRPRLLLWILLTYLPDLLVMPLLYTIGLGLLLLLMASGAGVLFLLGWLAAFQLLQLNAGALFVSAHGDDFSLLKVLPLFGLYSGILLNTAWLISVFDELQGRGMRW